ELLRGDNPTPASDVYSIAITMAEAIIGKPLLNFENSVEAAQAQLSPEPLKVPEELKASSLWPWLEKALKKELSERYQSADEMLQALDSGVSGLASLNYVLPSSNPKTPVEPEPPLPSTQGEVTPVMTTGSVLVGEVEDD